MMLVYIAGPFTGRSAWDVQKNVHAALERAHQVVELGAMPVIPHSMTQAFDGEQTPNFWYEGTLKLALRCDALLTTKGNGWRQSKGTVGEIAAMEAFFKPVFHEIRDFEDWLAMAEPIRGLPTLV